MSLKCNSPKNVIALNRTGLSLLSSKNAKTYKRKSRLRVAVKPNKFPRFIRMLPSSAGCVKAVSKRLRVFVTMLGFRLSFRAFKCVW
jgi:hypothetical protein